MTLTREQWERVEGLFGQALSLSPSERASLLAASGGEDPTVLEELSAMLAASEGTDSLDEPVRVTSLREAEPALPPGTTLGPWRVEDRIGAGGMGEVYVARRADGAYEAEAALKVLKRGLDTGEWIGRFLRERRLLARLAHPHIARLLDGGSTPEGRPYFVMELVRGVPITEHCRRYGGATVPVLRLMATVCDAVHEAHRNLVVHRDLKPSNVLVAEDGTVKVLDFGVAKLLAEEAGDLTRHGVAALTPAYAAPEQILGEEVTTATDVYALGAMLYELLTGRLPYRRESVAAAVAALARGEEPLAFPGVLARQRDLACIVGKALHREPQRRYRSAADLGDDLRCVLETRPVSARPDSLGYRTRRFVRRHRGSVAAAVLALNAVVAGAGVAWWQARRARLEAAKATAIKDFVVGLFALNTIEGDSPARARSTTVEQLLALASQRIRSELTPQPELRGELLGLLGDLNQDLGRYDEALALQRERLPLADANGGTRDRVSARIEIAQSQAGLERLDEARAQLAEAQRILEASGGGAGLEQGRLWLLLAQLDARTRPKTDPAARRHAERALALLAEHHPQAPERVQALYTLGEILYHAGQGSLARDTVRSGIALARQSHPGRKWLVGQGVQALAEVTDYDDWRAMVASYRESVQVLGEVYGPEHPRTARAEVGLGMALHDTVSRDEGRALMARGVEKLARRLPEDAAESLDARMILGTACMFEGRLQEARPFLEEVARVWSGKEPETVGNATAQLRLGTLYTQLGRYEEADRRLREAIAIRTRVRGASHPYTAQARYKHAELLRAQGRTPEATRALREVRALLQDGPAAAVLALDIALAAALNDAGRATEAERLAGAAVARIRAGGDRDADRDYEASALVEHSRALRALGRATEALAQAREGVARRAAISWESSPLLAEARIELAQCLLALGNRDEAARELARARAAHAAQPELGAHYRRALRDAETRWRAGRG